MAAFKRLVKHFSDAEIREILEDAYKVVLNKMYADEYFSAPSATFDLTIDKIIDVRLHKKEIEIGVLELKERTHGA